MSDNNSLDVSFEEVSPGDQTETPELPSNTFFNQPEFLSSVPEQDRAIVQKYLKPVMSGWDAGINKKLEERANEVKKWSELGDYEEVQKARHFFNNFRTNGETIFAEMVKGYFQHYGDQAPAKLNELLGVKVSDFQGAEEYDYSEGEPDPNEVFQQNVMKELEEFRSWREEQQQAQVEQQLNTQLDNILGQMHTARPDIPQDYILQGISGGVDPQHIVDNYDALVKSISSQQQSRPQPPIVMGGQGSIPSGQVDVSKLDANGRKSAVEQWLAASAE